MKMTRYEQESLTALYLSLTFCKENDLPCEDIDKAIETIELKNSLTPKARQALANHNRAF